MSLACRRGDGIIHDKLALQEDRQRGEVCQKDRQWGEVAGAQHTRVHTHTHAHTIDTKCKAESYEVKALARVLLA